MVKRRRGLSSWLRKTLGSFLVLLLVTPTLVSFAFMPGFAEAEGIDSSTTLLLHMDGSDASTTFTDSSDSGHTVTVGGDTQIDTAQSEFGGASGLFDGNNDTLEISHATDFDFGTGDFTIDLWIRPSSLTGEIMDDLDDDIEFFLDGSGDIVFNDSSGDEVLCSAAISVNTWQHVAVVRSGSTVTMYIDGTSCGSDADMTSNYDLNGWHIGNYVVDNTLDYSGHIDELRFSVGVARWTSNFTAPSSAYSVDGGNDDDVVLLVHGDGSDASTSFPDSSASGHTVTAGGDAQVDTAQSKFGTASALFDGTDDNLAVTHATDFDFSGDFTIDAWIRPASTNGTLYTDSSEVGVFFYLADDGGTADLVFENVSSSILAVCDKAVSTGSWQHVAVVRSGSTVTLYVDGISCGTDSTASTAIDISGIYIGQLTGLDYSGHIDEFRVSKGVARWTSNFTPPTAAYSAAGAEVLGVPTLYDDDGSNQIAFNNSRQNDTSPIFRISALYDDGMGGEDFDRFQIEMSTSSVFAGTTYVQTFSSTYASSTVYNLTADSLSPSLPTTDGETYHVRARISGDSGSTWSNWSTDNQPTWTYTYASSGDPDWFQTTEAQFGTGTLVDTATTTGGVILSSGSGDITYVSATEAGTGAAAASLSINVPSGVTDDDFLLLFGVTADGDDGGFDALSGWTEIVDAAVLNTGGSAPSPPGMSVWWRIASSEPASYSITPTFGSTGIAAQMLAFRNVDTSTPLDVTQTTATGDSTNANPASIGSGSSSDGYLTAVAAFWDSTSAVYSAVPSGYTSPESLGSIVGNGGGNGTSLASAYRSSVIDPAAAEDPAAFTSSTEQWGAVTVAMRPGPSAATVGTTTSTAISFDSIPTGTTWDQVTVNGDITNGSITVNVLGADTQPLSSYSCTVSGSSCTIDISGLDPAGTPNEATIYLEAVLTDSGGSPTLQDWSVSWVTTVAPTVTSSAASSVTDTTATLNGNITDTGGETGSGTQHGFAWGTNSTLSGGDTATTTLGTYSGTGAFTDTVSSLSSGTTYYFRAYAVNSMGTSTGSILSFTTLDVPTVTSNAASSVTGTSATLNGNITDTGGENATRRGFTWGTVATLIGGDTATTTNVGSYSTGAFSEGVSSLSLGTTYYFRAYAENSVATSTGTILSFTTLDVPTVATNAASDVTTTSATLNGTISADGGDSITEHGFAWGTGSTLVGGDTATTTLGAGSEGSFTDGLSSLDPGTTYYYRAYAVNSAGTTLGSIATFDTTVAAPTISASAATNVDADSADLNGNITSTGGETGSGTQHGFAWGTNSALSGGDTATTTLGTYADTGAFSEALSSLTSNATYYFRPYVTNSANTAYGSILSFTTRIFFGSGGFVGVAAPAGQGVQSGGSSDTGEEIGGEVGFLAPSASGLATGWATGWSSAAAAYASDGSDAMASAVGASDFYNFNFSVPAGNTINGIAVKLEAAASEAGGTIGAELSWNGGSATTTASIATSALTTSDVVYTLGGSSSLWGRSWDPSEFSNANFRLRLVPNPSNNTLQLDAIQVRVYHQASGGGSGGGSEI